MSPAIIEDLETLARQLGIPGALSRMRLRDRQARRR